MRKVQENVKQTIQNMTGITVSRVDVLVVGLTDAAEKSKRIKERQELYVWRKS